MVKSDEDPSMVSQAQRFVHTSTCTLVIPALMFTASMVLLFYRGVTQDHTDMPLNGFLANIMLQMTPLLMLKAKIWSCSDRVSLVPLVLCKTLLLHVLLGAARCGSQVIDGLAAGRMVFGLDCAVFFGALVILKTEFEFTLNPMQWMMHHDVRNLAALCLVASLITEVGLDIIPTSWMSEDSKTTFSAPLAPDKILFTFANYVDIVAFMPVVWRLYQAEQENDDYNIGTNVSTGAKRQVKWFFAYIVTFYGWDDVVYPCTALLEEPMALMAHAAHIILILDFAGFFLFQVSAPPSNVQELGMERGEQLQGLLSQDEDDPY